MKRLVKIAALIIVSFFIGNSLCAADRNFYKDRERGFYWGKDASIQEEKKSIDQKNPSVKKQPYLRDYTDEELWRMDPDSFNELRETITKRAVGDTSNEEYIGEYTKITLISAKRAAAFANAHQAYLLKHPEYNITSAAPLAEPGRQAISREIKREVAGKINGAQGDFALIYFSQAGCNACQEQSKILEYFTDKYGWNIKEIDIARRQATARAFSIQTTPTLILVSKNSGEHLYITVGVSALTEIEDNLYRGIRLLNHEITPEEFGNYELHKGSPLDTGPPRK